MGELKSRLSFFFPRQISRGHIEDSRRFAKNISETSFPRQISRGHIEDGHFRRHLSVPTPFRGRSVAATLKNVVKELYADLFGAFRGRSVAATLKKLCSSKPHQTIAPFPRQISRGHIEDSTRSIAIVGQPFFPRQISRGHIEDSSKCRSSSSLAPFPRQISRGHIEDWRWKLILSIATALSAADQSRPH